MDSNEKFCWFDKIHWLWISLVDKFDALPDVVDVVELLLELDDVWWWKSLIYNWEREKKESDLKV